MTEYPHSLDVLTDHRSAAIVQIESLGRGGLAAILLGLLAVCFVACWAVSRAERAYERAEAAERRSMDATYDAKQEASLAREDVRVLTAELNKRGIPISTSH